MQIVYLNHSGFLIQTDDKKAIVIDYYDDTKGSDEGYLHDLLKQDYKFYFLSSHHHNDHFAPCILDFEAKDKTYILSYDIISTDTMDKSKLKHYMRFLEKGDVFEDDNIKVVACGSTDAGISFVIEVDGKVIFHAGDLNNWHWQDESSKAEIRAAQRYFSRELEFIYQRYNSLDVAMFPIDPRMGTDFALGAMQFVEKINVKTFIPMHFWQFKDKANECKDDILKFTQNFVEIKDKGQIINID